MDANIDQREICNHVLEEKTIMNSLNFETGEQKAKKGFIVESFEGYIAKAHYASFDLKAFSLSGCLREKITVKGSRRKIPRPHEDKHGKTETALLLVNALNNYDI